MKPLRLHGCVQNRDVAPEMGIHRFGEPSDIGPHALTGATRHLAGGMHTAIGAPREMHWDGLAGDLLQRPF